MRLERDDKDIGRTSGGSGCEVLPIVPTRSAGVVEYRRLPSREPDPLVRAIRYVNTLMSESSDAEIIADSIDQPHVFTALFDRYAQGIYRFIARRIGAVDAHDVVSQTFLVAFENRARYDAAFPSARPWLYGIASNVMRHHCRSEARAWRAMAVIGTEDEPSFVDDVVDRVDGWARTAAMAEVLADLEDRDRDVLLLFAWEEFSYAEIAAALAIPVGTVRSRLHRARTQLQKALGQPTLEEINR